VHGEAQLFEAVQVHRAPGALFGLAQRRQQQRRQDADDRDDHQQFDQVNAGPVAGRRVPSSSHHSPG